MSKFREWTRVLPGGELTLVTINIDAIAYVDSRVGGGTIVAFRNGLEHDYVALQEPYEDVRAWLLGDDQEEVVL